jgi:uncharacterized protein (UPF0548 family)
MFLTRRPSADAIHRFLDDSRELPLSYAPPGILRQETHRGRLDEEIVAIGHGHDDFVRARAALSAWTHFDIGWVELFPRHAPLETGTVVAVLIRHFGLWSLNGARVLYHVSAADDRPAFGFAYGTLTNHAESGEELFEVFVDARSGDVMYRIRAVSWPQAVIARIGQPFVRVLQARFRRDSAAAMKRATRRYGVVAAPTNV